MWGRNRARSRGWLGSFGRGEGRGGVGREGGRWVRSCAPANRSCKTAASGSHGPGRPAPRLRRHRTPARPLGFARAATSSFVQNRGRPGMARGRGGGGGAKAGRSGRHGGLAGIGSKALHPAMVRRGSRGRRWRGTSFGLAKRVLTTSADPSSLEAAAWMKRCCSFMPVPSKLEIRRLHELVD